MTFKLRDYQQTAVDSVINHIKKCIDPCLLELATGAGKSLIVAEVAKWIADNTQKKVLCLAPSKELVEQNRAKYLAYGFPASIFSASAGGKCTKNKVVFGTPGTVANAPEKFGPQFGAVIIDEAHGVTPTIKKIVEAMKEANPKLRVIGLTATPYRMGSGYIYEVDESNTSVPEGQTKEPYFKKLLYRVTANELINQGYLTRPNADIKEGYDTSQIDHRNAATIEKAFEGLGRKTSEIVSQIVELSKDRQGVMIFAATVRHAFEVLASLPQDNSALVISETKDRQEILARFKNKQIKYLVNVAVLTTGFDAPHVDVVAVLRATESPGLFQQIIGRGLRLCDGKEDCLILDYAENIERHELEGDLFNPNIKVNKGNSEKFIVDAICSVCNMGNGFSGRPNLEEFDVNKWGYFVDLAGNEIIVDGVAMPAHFGRRCNNHTIQEGTLERCNGRWSSKECHECEADNDIAARYCTSCKAELVDPNEKLRLDFKRMKQSPKIPSSDKVVSWYAQPWTSKAGNESLRIDWTTEYRSFSSWYSPNSRTSNRQKLWADLNEAVFNGRIAPNIDMFIAALKKGQGTMPVTISSHKEGDFFKILGHNRPEDKL